MKPRFFNAAAAAFFAAPKIYIPISASVFTNNSLLLPFVWTDALTTNFPTRFHRVLPAP